MSLAPQVVMPQMLHTTPNALGRTYERIHTLQKSAKPPYSLVCSTCVADFGGEYDPYIVLTHLGLHHVNPNVS